MSDQDEPTRDQSGDSESGDAASRDVGADAVDAATVSLGASVYPDAATLPTDAADADADADGPDSPYPDGWGPGGVTARTPAPLPVPAGAQEYALIPPSMARETSFEPPADLPPWYEDDYYDDSDWDDLPRETSTSFRIGIFLMILIALIVGSGAVVKNWLDHQLDPPGETGTEAIVIEIPQGATTNDIVRILGDEHIVANATVFRYYLQYKDASDFQAGEYTFYENMPVWDVRDVLESGSRVPPTFQVQILEGLTVEEIKVALLEQLPQFDAAELEDAFAAIPKPEVLGEITPRNAEGLLFPDTYEIDEAGVTDEAGLLRRLVDQFDQVAREIGLDEAEEAVGLNPYRALIVASLIEEEAQADVDRAKISRVIYNRLEQGWNLGIDATIVYALGGDRELSQSDLETDSPYNTRTKPGLPPSPIAVPSRKSLEAALNPAEGPWMYYVRTDENGEGTHTFSVTDQEHNAAVQICIERGLGC